MRIRSIKPEFWRSDDVNAMCVDDRLLFIGLWSYVDDNGVGIDRQSDIAADLFAHDLSVSPHGVLMRVSDGLNRLHTLGVIRRYTVETKRYLEIANWSKHQKINRPSPGRFPTSSDPAAAIHAPLTEDSLSPHENVLPGTGEQGNRGTGEQGRTPRPERNEVTHLPAQRETKSVARMQALNETAVGAAAIEVARGYTAWAGNGIDSRTQHEIAREVDPLLADGIDPHQIANGIKAWHASDSWSPTQLRRFVAKAAKPATDHQPTKATQRAMDTMAAAEQIIAEMQGQTA